MRVLPAAALAILCLALGPAGARAQADAGAKTILRGVGATFPAILYKKWIGEYTKADPRTVIDYRDLGSGEGQKRFLDHSVDFGASDAALSDEQLARAPGAKLIPTVAGILVVVYNLPGLNAPLRLPRTVYPEIFAGRITKWNDTRIQEANPELKLPDRDIVLAVRLDGSGTTYALTNHLNAVSETWRRSGRGVNTVVGWAGNAMLARGNEGVAALVQRNPWTLGYVEFAYGKRLRLPMAPLQNKAGRFVEPTAASGEAAIAANLNEIPANLRVFMPDPAGENSYPIVTLTWLLLYEKYAETGKADALKRFVDWALTSGQPIGTDLGYIPLPAGLAERARAVAQTVQ